MMTELRTASGAAGAGIALHGNWRKALAQAIERARTQLDDATVPSDETSEQPPVDLALLFASAHYADDFPEVVTTARSAAHARLLVGCSGAGVIGPRREIEQQPALSILLLRLPGVQLTLRYLTQETLDAAGAEDGGESELAAALGPDAAAARAWLLFADPFRLDVEALVVGMAQTFPEATVVGGLASGNPMQRKTHLFIDDGDQPVPVRDEGALLIGLGGDWTVRTLVAQGCIPIGEPWTITESEGPIIHTIAGRPALDVLVDTLQALPPEVQRRAQRGGPFVGLAVDEHRTTLGPGDFLVRNLLGFDRERGVIAVGAHAQVGQTLQFHLRDRAAADEELHSMLSAVEAEGAVAPPLAALLCSCTGRGEGLFGTPDHDADAVARALGPVPLAGFFCNGEIGPVGKRSYVHGYTASLALLVHDPPGIPD